MCLFYPVEIARNKDIVCYKILKKINDDTYVSPFYPDKAKKWVLNKTKKLKSRPIPGFTYSFGNQDIIKIIEGNALHSCKTLLDAIHYSTVFLDSEDSSDYFIVKCVIPKSSVIYEGVTYTKNDWECSSYASSQLKPVEIISSINDIDLKTL